MRPPAPDSFSITAVAAGDALRFAMVNVEEQSVTLANSSIVPFSLYGKGDTA